LIFGSGLFFSEGIVLEVFNSWTIPAWWVLMIFSAILLLSASYLSFSRRTFRLFSLVIVIALLLVLPLFLINVIYTSQTTALTIANSQNADELKDILEKNWCRLLIG
jgi:TRAP-type uncharacterized transport system fused permease subunit